MIVLLSKIVKREGGRDWQKGERVEVSNAYGRELIKEKKGKQVAAEAIKVEEPEPIEDTEESKQ